MKKKDLFRGTGLSFLQQAFQPAQGERRLRRRADDQAHERGGGHLPAATRLEWRLPAAPAGEHITAGFGAVVGGACAFDQSVFASRKMVEMMQAKPMRSVQEKAVPSHRAEKTVADNGSVAASMEAFTGPTS